MSEGEGFYVDCGPFELVPKSRRRLRMRIRRTCENCNGWKCMDCVCRYQHEDCVEDCPVCCLSVS